jgi:hypothetical protein
MSKVKNTKVLLFIIIRIQNLTLAIYQNENKTLPWLKIPHPMATGGIMYCYTSHVSGMMETAQTHIWTSSRYRDQSLHLTKPKLSLSRIAMQFQSLEVFEIMKKFLLQKVMVTNLQKLPSEGPPMCQRYGPAHGNGQ